MDAKTANVVYHDYEAEQYDEKWSISYDERCVEYARDRFVRMAGTEGWPYGTVLEIGCGTGFFTLNLKLAGVIGEAHVTDISPGMVKVAERNARDLGFEVHGKVADAESLPYDDDTFDLVVGHAVLHHIPDVEQALREVLRVLKPGGRFVVAGEPTTYGDLVARKLSHAAWVAATHLSHLPPFKAGWSRPKDELKASSEAAALESQVDLHTFHPNDLARLALAAGAADVRVDAEELTAAWAGWPIRTVEYAVNPERLGTRWKLFAFDTWRRLTWVDETLLRPFVPKAFFYNALVTGTKP
ncbi:MAG TPA: class I SAM-dependent methyltransferase [Frankiaceae bacterium]|nr:class I SAM-dependent methyltransferase [Frankiaceae bacterium]